MNASLRFLISFFASLFFICSSAYAVDQATEAEQKAAAQEAEKLLQHGPVSIDIQDQAKLALPAGTAFIPSAAAARYLRSLGNRVNEQGLVGIIVPTDGTSSWMSVLTVEKAGYVRDDDAKDWKADDILSNLKEGTEAANAERTQHGIPEIEVTGWAEIPKYDSATHKLVWSAIVANKGKHDAPSDLSVNYRTLALGREGYLSLTMVSSLDLLQQYKPAAQQLLAAISFNEGKRYIDFNASTDHVAEYGLAALVAGVAIKKLGLFALVAAFFAKFFKVILLAVFGFGAAFKKFFTGKAKTASPTVSGEDTHAPVSTVLIPPEAQNTPPSSPGPADSR
ncbi:DUF2167 domain-containing protein [Herbaspirillum huttiense F1]|uniref:DUF2167 domain-containing protein n=1 Tax=Herbaspirillum huttiense subsp. lycopersici TaxID=3074428 RepID=A0ABU2ERZ4_9BURK|nr:MULTISPECIES: DUF2167 domain-containing protein [Herbaspirillum]MBP1317519.1 putative membrane-anchored protein [Herbaspirillum sp. 1130]MDR9850944.1 DUF2167 domain-containing protein [Herbaspirillum huttiense SE1]MDT0359156.1 DUF2167 domain-containing protein [Herbaspirillum huttiense F1]